MRSLVPLDLSDTAGQDSSRSTTCRPIPVGGGPLSGAALVEHDHQALEVVRRDGGPGRADRGVTNPMTDPVRPDLRRSIGHTSAVGEGANSTIFAVDASGVLGYRQVATDDLAAGAITSQQSVGPVSQSTTSASLVDITGLSITWTAIAGEIVMLALCGQGSAGTAVGATFSVLLDGVGSRTSRSACRTLAI